MEKEIANLPENEREAAKTEFAVFVVHNKLKEKAEQLPEDIPYEPSDYSPDADADGTYPDISQETKSRTTGTITVLPSWHRSNTSIHKA